MSIGKTLKTTAILLATSGTMIAPAAVAASVHDVSVEIDTRYLETGWGVEKVYKTLIYKAKSACSMSGTSGVSNRKIERDCMSNLLDDFIKNADHEKLTAYHANAVN